MSDACVDGCENFAGLGAITAQAIEGSKSSRLYRHRNHPIGMNEFCDVRDEFWLVDEQRVLRFVLRNGVS